jgi:cytochrome c oxidase cbb3-type subunit IV
MTLGLFRGLLTAALFLSFIGLWIWAWSKRRQADFDDAARLPLADEPARSELS